MNTTTITGRLTKDVAYFAPKGDNKHGIARFSVALDHRKDAETVFVNVVAYNQAEFARDYLKKGQRYLFTTHLKNAKDKDGKVTGIELVLDEVEFLEAKKPAGDVEPAPVGGDDEPLPFQ